MCRLILLALVSSVVVPGRGQVLTEANAAVVRTNRIETGVAVCGGGLAGVCAAIAAARRIGRLQVADAGRRLARAACL